MVDGCRVLKRHRLHTRNPLMVISAVRPRIALHWCLQTSHITHRSFVRKVGAGLGSWDYSREPAKIHHIKCRRLQVAFIRF